MLGNVPATLCTGVFSVVPTCVAAGVEVLLFSRKTVPSVVSGVAVVAASEVSSEVSVVSVLSVVLLAEVVVATFAGVVVLFCMSPDPWALFEKLTLRGVIRHA